MITCHAKCRFRQSDACGVVASGYPIEIGGDGRCRTREEYSPEAQTPNDPVRICSHDECREMARTSCHRCHQPVCLDHRWVHPTGGYPLCILCWISHGPAVYPGRDEDTYEQPA